MAVALAAPAFPDLAQERDVRCRSGPRSIRAEHRAACVRYRGHRRMQFVPKPRDRVLHARFREQIPVLPRIRFEVEQLAPRWFVRIACEAPSIRDDRLVIYPRIRAWMIFRKQTVAHPGSPALQYVA